MPSPLNDVSSVPSVQSGEIGAYLGVPVQWQDGAIVAVLCVFDGRPRSWTTADVEVVQRAASLVAGHLQALDLSEEPAP